VHRRPFVPSSADAAALPAADESSRAPARRRTDAPVA
jgi:hypothetical protein